MWRPVWLDERSWTRDPLPEPMPLVPHAVARHPIYRAKRALSQLFAREAVGVIDRHAAANPTQVRAGQMMLQSVPHSFALQHSILECCN